MDFDLIHSHERIFKADIITLHSIPHPTWIREVRQKKRLSLFDHATSWVEKEMFHRSDCRMFLPVSHLVREKIEELFPLDERKIKVVHPGVDVERFKAPNLRHRYEIRKEFGISETDLVLLFVSMNFEVKGLDTLIEAVARIKSKQNNHPIKVLVVGKGNKKKYRRLAHNLGIGEQIIFAGIRTDMERIYPAGDMLAMLSKFDTFGMVVTEAMAASLPVLISDTVGAKDLVVQGENGFVVNRENIGMVSDNIVFMLNKDKRLEMGKKAYHTALNNTWEKMTQKVLAVYEEIL